MLGGGLGFNASQDGHVAALRDIIADELGRQLCPGQVIGADEGGTINIGFGVDEQDRHPFADGLL